jgi:hypothetical protein
MKIAVFWDVTPCSLVEVYRCYRSVYCVCHYGSLVSACLTDFVQYLVITLSVAFLICHLASANFTVSVSNFSVHLIPYFVGLY